MCQVIYTYDMKFRVTHAQFNLPFNSVDHILVTTTLDTTVVKSSVHKSFRYKGYDHLMDSRPCSPTASLEMHETTKPKGA